MEFLRGLAPGWKVAASVAVLTVVVFAGLVAARRSIPGGAGSLYLQFWPPLAPAVPVKNSAVEIQSLRAELTGLLAARSKPSGRNG